MEPQAPGTVAPGERAPGVYEPPPPELFLEPPPPPPAPHYVAPRTAFWAGVRAGVLVPFGTVWVDGADVGTGIYYRRRTFSDYASPGPEFEIDLGARLSRRYNLFALWEHAVLGTGGLDENALGGQNRGASNLYGGGFRFSTEPDSVGFLLEVAFGYRDFHAYWSDGTELTLKDAFDSRIGLGADIRLNPTFTLEPMVVLGGGTFHTARWSGPRGSADALGPLDDLGNYGTLTLQLGFHLDAH